MSTIGGQQCEDASWGKQRKERGHVKIAPCNASTPKADEDDCCGPRSAAKPLVSGIGSGPGAPIVGPPKGTDRCCKLRQVVESAHRGWSGLTGGGATWMDEVELKRCGLVRPDCEHYLSQPPKDSTLLEMEPPAAQSTQLPRRAHSRRTKKIGGLEEDGAGHVHFLSENKHGCCRAVYDVEHKREDDWACNALIMSNSQETALSSTDLRAHCWGPVDEVWSIGNGAATLTCLDDGEETIRYLEVPAPASDSPAASVYLETSPKHKSLVLSGITK